MAPLADSEIKRILVVTAHPDDLDFGAGGTIAQWSDKGIEVSIPLDLFYSYSCKKRWKYAISAWLRDVGAISEIGRAHV